MFNRFFGTTQDENTKEEIMAGIKYFIDDQGEIKVDIELKDYSDESIDALARVLAALSLDDSYLQTVHMLQQSLAAEGQDEALLKIYSHLAANPNDKAVRIHKEKNKETPCIRPSDML